MNVFEDLIEELRDENLLEQTVIDVNGSRNHSSAARGPRVSGGQNGPVGGSDGEFELLLGRYARRVAEKLAEFCTPGSVVWECGAYIGYFTSLFARLVGPQGHVVVFEPDPSNK